MKWVLRTIFSPEATRRWISPDIPRLRNQSNRAKSTILTCVIYTKGCYEDDDDCDDDDDDDDDNNDNDDDGNDDDGGGDGDGNDDDGDGYDEDGDGLGWW